MTQSYLGTVALAALAILLALSVRNIDEIWAWITGPLAGGLFVPIVLRWYWWRLNGYGFALATAAGLAVSLWTQTRPDLAFFEASLAAWSASLVAGVAGSLLTAPTDRATLESFWRRIRPFGLWGPVRARLDPSEVAATMRRNRLDLLHVPAAIGWHLSGVVAVISLLLHKWWTCAGGAVVFAVLSTVLYFGWYRKLEESVEPAAAE